MRSEKPLNLQFLVAKIQRKSEITKDLAKKRTATIQDDSSRQAGQSERVIETRSRNSCQVAGWSKQDHRNSPPHFLPIGAALLSGLSSVTTLGCTVGYHPAVCSYRTIASVLYGCLAQCRSWTLLQRGTHLYLLMPKASHTVMPGEVLGYQVFKRVERNRTHRPYTQKMGNRYAHGQRPRLKCRHSPISFNLSKSEINATPVEA